jgi:hypothetical protein
MINQQRKSWQIVPPIIIGGEIPLADVELTAQHHEWQITPPVVTGAHLPAVKGVRPAPAPHTLNTDRQMYRLNQLTSSEQAQMLPLQSHFPAQPFPGSRNERPPNYFSQPMPQLAMPEQELVEKQARKTRDRSGASSWQRSLTVAHISLRDMEHALSHT